MKINVLFYSVMGHTYEMAKAEAEGAEEAGADVRLYRIPETLPEEILQNIPGIEAQQQWGDLPEADHHALTEADGLIFGTPTRFGNMCGQMRAFFDSTGPLWLEGALIGKVGSVFTSTASQHGGQESTILTIIPTLMHHGMIVVGCPYSEQRLLELDEISGGTPYGASTIAGPEGKRQPTENELQIARSQGRHVAEVTAKMADA